MARAVRSRSWGAEKTGDGVADGAAPHQAALLQALAQPVEVVAALGHAGEVGVGSPRLAAQGDDAAVRRALESFCHAWAAMGTDLLFHEVTRGEVLIGHAQKQKPSVEVEHGAHRGLRVPTVLTAGVDDVVPQRPDGGDGLHDVDRAARVGAAEDMVGNGAGRARRLRRVEDETGLAELPGEGGRNQRSRRVRAPRASASTTVAAPPATVPMLRSELWTITRPPRGKPSRSKIGREFRACSSFAAARRGLKHLRRRAHLRAGACR